MDRVRILLCCHQNVAGCPNHGAVAREMLAAMRRQFAGRESALFVFGEREAVPIPYSLTDKGHDVAAEEIDPFAWLP